MDNKMRQKEQLYDQRINVQPNEFETINDSDVYTWTPEQMKLYIEKLKNNEAMKKYKQSLQSKNEEEIDISPRRK